MASLNDYRRMIAAYAQQHPIDAPDSWAPVSPEAMVGGWTDRGVDWEGGEFERQQAEQFQDWLNSLTPEQRADYRRAADERNAHNLAITKGVAALFAAGVGGAGAGLFGNLGAAGAVEGAAGAGLGAAGGELGMAGWFPEVAGVAGNNLSAWLPAGGSEWLASQGLAGAGTASVPSWALPGGATAGELAGMGLGASSGTGAFSGMGEYIKSLGTSLGKDALKGAGSNWLNQLITGGTAAYTGNKATGQYNDLLKEINALYSPDSPYAKQMQQAMARKDAAAGRNSQYGTRAVELAAALTNSKANALTSAGYGNLMQQRGLAQNQFPASMIALLQSQQGQDLITKAGGGIGSWLGGLFTSGGDKVTPTTPNVGTNPNWWENWGGYIGGGP